MQIKKDSIDKFISHFILSQDDIKQLRNHTIKQGQLVIMYNVINQLTMFPKVLSHIIEEYCADYIDYTLKYPLIPGINVRRIILSINCDEYKFNHDIYCGTYDMANETSRAYIDTSLRIRCPHIHTKRSLHKDIISFMGSYTSVHSDSYNDNILSRGILLDSQFDFGLLLDHIANTKKSFWKRWFSKSTFVNTKTDVLIYNKSDNIMRIKFPSGEVIEINIINQYNLDMCIQINKMIFDLLQRAQLKYPAKAIIN
jgi:hypothetical protein